MKNFTNKYSFVIMKLQLILAVAIFCWLQIKAEDEEKYTTKYDNVNFDEIITSDRLLKNYLNCLLDRGSCTPDARELKRVLPDALETDCKKCSKAQKIGIGKVIRYLIAQRREWWNDLEAKYDPDGKYLAKYKAELKNEGISLR